MGLRVTPPPPAEQFSSRLILCIVNYLKTYVCIATVVSQYLIYPGDKVGSASNCYSERA